MPEHSDAGGESGYSRRRVLQATGGITATGLLSLSGVPTAGATTTSSASWSQAGYDAANSGHNPAGMGPVGLGTEWQGVGNAPVADDQRVYAVGGGNGVTAYDKATGQEVWSYAYFYGNAYRPSAVVDGKVIVAGEPLRALDAETGTEVWSVFGMATTDGQPAAPTVANGTIYAGDGPTLAAIDPADGSKDWEVEAGGEVTGAPAVVDGKVYVVTTETDGTAIEAYDAADGSQVWVESTATLGFENPTPVVADGTVLSNVSTSDGYEVQARDAASGAVEWTANVRAVGKVAVDGDTVYALAHDGTVHAYELATGSEQWTFQTGLSGDQTTADHGPAVADGTVYAGVGSGDSSAVVHALDADTGSERTSVTFTGLEQSRVGSLALDDAALYATVGEQLTAITSSTGWQQAGHDAANTGHNPAGIGPAGLDTEWQGVGNAPVTDDQRVYAVGGGNGVTAYDKSTGQERWSYQYFYGNAYRPSAVVDGKVIVAGEPLRALDAATGTEEWSVFGMATTDGQPAAPTVANGTIYAGDGPTLAAIDPADGSKDWEVEAGGEITGAPAVANGTVYVVTADSDGTGIEAYDAADGSQVWVESTTTLGFENPTPVVAAGTVLANVSTSDGYEVQARDAASGAVEWTIDVRAVGKVAVDGDTVYALAHDGTVHAYELATGTQQWTFQTGLDSGDLVSADHGPVVADGTIYVGVGDGSSSAVVHALDADTGSERTSVTFTGLDDASTGQLALDSGGLYADVDDSVYDLS